jgi:dTDP-glucose pyrophosphorylase/CBS domain-containing protein
MSTLRAANFDKLVISHSRSIREAMQLITDNLREVALVTGDEAQLIGVVTDGDIRRGLLKGLGLDAPVSAVMTTEYTAVGSDSDRASVLDLMMARSIRHVPIVDAKRKLLGIHFMQDLIGAAERPNAAVIMAGGQGVRLRPLTEHLPKPMVQVAGRPILERIVLHLVGHGIREIYLAVNYKAAMIEQHFGDGSRFGCRISYLHETEPLGTGGPLSLLPQVPQHPLIVMNGDLITQVDISELLAFHEADAVGATIAARPYEAEIPFGVIRENAGRLIEIEEKPTSYHLINSGVYVLGREAVALVPKAKFFPITELFQTLLAKQVPVAVYTMKGDWIDVGRHEELCRARGEA